MSKIPLLIAILFFIPIKEIYGQAITYRIISKGIYFDFDKKDEKIKIPFKENQYFYFSLKNDSIALLQEVHKEKPGEIKEYKIAPGYDTTYVKKNSTLKSKSTTRFEKIIYRKVYDID